MRIQRSWLRCRDRVAFKGVQSAARSAAALKLQWHWRTRNAELRRSGIHSAAAVKLQWHWRQHMTARLATREKAVPPLPAQKAVVPPSRLTFRVRNSATIDFPEKPDAVGDESCATFATTPAMGAGKRARRPAKRCGNSCTLGGLASPGALDPAPLQRASSSRVAPVVLAPLAPGGSTPRSFGKVSPWGLPPSLGHAQPHGQPAASREPLRPPPLPLQQSAMDLDLGTLRSSSTSRTSRAKRPHDIRAKSVGGATAGAVHGLTPMAFLVPGSPKAPRGTSAARGAVPIHTTGKTNLPSIASHRRAMEETCSWSLGAVCYDGMPHRSGGAIF
eukprot:NODE_9033_length_1451_cov_9.708459.p1 GENE.NODE_9033_length_1451_cov_9.708459~~NODE_9033_length_1451_cov_9.708459.p1  ORF type:complete len:377 (-),score=49.19 NODE_9033_length_1451_cov_9.708459:319-1311(-)